MDYRYYEAPPYAPYGYYGPEWFVNGVFIGTDRGSIPEHGYKGPMPARGEARDPAKPVNKISHFKGNEVRDGRARREEIV